ncbi:cell wall hydrolase [Sporohalobacter salinus]|uniref:cell wall hydrolase n=1 Tax=Sporohalobacter salinus TaxID=1494606 RepID=UPI001961DBB2|nr:cell wall hydrolase [Sporohalobacter salinus]MBM7625090.1 N-acetylmuramoyl-L-alanine amidase [Sporohalobacter salinus]
MKKIAIVLIIMLFLSIGGWAVNSYMCQQTEPAQSRWAPNFWSLSPNERLMARTISAEARGETYLGQVAVGSVIMNRVESDKFPNSISGVIYQPWAFTAIARGHVWSHTPESNAIRAALDAMSGWDPTYGSIYYYNPAKVTTYWIFSRPQVRQIGKHIFAR